MQTTSDGVKRRKKEVLELDYNLSEATLASVEQHFEVKKRLTNLTQKTIKMWSEYNTTLPVDLHFDPADFAK